MAKPSKESKTDIPGTTKVPNLEEKRIQIAIENNEPCKETVIDLLEQTIQALKSGKIQTNKCVLILLEDYDTYYLHQAYAAGMIPQESITLCSLAEDDFKQELYGE